MNHLTNKNYIEIRINELPLDWKKMMWLGLFLVFAGALGMIYIVQVTLASILLFGALLIASGITQLIHAFSTKDKEWFGLSQHILIATIYIIAAAIIIWQPMTASLGITVAVACLFILIGLIRTWYAVVSFRNGWQWALSLISGLINIVLAGIILYSLPESSLWLLGLLISIELLTAGWLLILIAIKTKKTD